MFDTNHLFDTFQYVRLLLFRISCVTEIMIAAIGQMKLYAVDLVLIVPKTNFNVAMVFVFNKNGHATETMIVSTTLTK